MTSRRAFLTSAGTFAALTILPASRAFAFEVEMSEAAWQARLSPAQFAILRHRRTEQPFSNSLFGEYSPLLKEARTGTYNCAGCALPVYPSTTKFNSRTGWPSFWDSISGAVGTKSDKTWFTTRTEVHCRRCGGHFGHIFADGPKPTGKRHCLNGLSLTFSAA